MFTDYRLLKHPYAWIALGFGTGLAGHGLAALAHDRLGFCHCGQL